MSITNRKNMSRKLKSICSTEYPVCAPNHGPTIYFYYDEEPESGYFACAAFRNKNDCSFYLSYQDYIQNRGKGGACGASGKSQANDIQMRRENVSHYCTECDEFLERSEVRIHQHKSIEEIKAIRAKDPTKFLKPLSVDDSQAQYFFDEKALAFFLKCFQDMNISKVICMGAPRLHKYLDQSSRGSIKSYLLDFDHRFHYFLEDSEYAWYNMCNNYFFNEEQKAAFHEFLKRSTNDEVPLIFTDPPFGCRTETIAQTLTALSKLYNQINGRPHRPLPIFWIFPYFSEHYIKDVMPEMQMSDYKVNYTNHSVYADKGDKLNRKLGSPVRVFTNVPLERLRLPEAEGYKFCQHCKIFTAAENRHCGVCGCCPSKNGSAYRHCYLCDMCVKPNYMHCTSCRRCIQKNFQHSCPEYQAHQQCWICLRIGHIEHNCPGWLAYCERNQLKRMLKPTKKSKTTRICFICNRAGHNEKKCRERAKHLLETSFMSSKEVHFR